ncbi:MAG: hypothetical protein RL026_1571 [Pseudomonadota bacterium]
MNGTVVYVVSLFPCWSETFIVREIEALLRRGVDVRIVSLKAPSEAMVHPQAERLMDRVVCAEMRGGTWRAFRTKLRHPWIVARAVGIAVAALWRHPVALLKTLATFQRSLALVDWLKDVDPRHIHAHWATYASSGAWLMAQVVGKPFSYTTHAHDLFLEDHFIARKIRDSVFTVTISRFNVELIRKRYGEAVAAKVRVVHCGVDLAEFDAAGGAGAPTRLLSVGRLDPIKGFDVLIDACARLRDAGHEFHCEIIGEGGLRPALEAQIVQLGLQGRVTLPGARPQHVVRAAMSQAGLFIMPSVVAADGNMDGIPVALMEAMAMKRAVVSTYVSGIPEIIEDGITGLLVNPGDATALASALERLLLEPALRETLGIGARACVSRDFDADVEGGKIHEMISAGSS